MPKQPPQYPKFGAKSRSDCATLTPRRAAKLAMLPASFGLGAGAETNGPLAVAVIGGIVSSTLLTLVVVPAAYSLLENALAKRRG